MSLSPASGLSAAPSPMSETVWSENDRGDPEEVMSSGTAGTSPLSSGAPSSPTDGYKPFTTAVAALPLKAHAPGVPPTTNTTTTAAATTKARSQSPQSPNKSSGGRRSNPPSRPHSPPASAHVVPLHAAALTSLSSTHPSSPTHSPFLSHSRSHSHFHSHSHPHFAIPGSPGSTSAGAPGSAYGDAHSSVGGDGATTADSASIFERDVEHRDAGRVFTAQEATDLAIPTVLDDAVEALAEEDGEENLEIIAPAPAMAGTLSNLSHLAQLASPVGSPSPSHPPSPPASALSDGAGGAPVVAPTMPNVAQLIAASGDLTPAAKEASVAGWVAGDPFAYAAVHHVGSPSQQQQQHHQQQQQQQQHGHGHGQQQAVGSPIGHRSVGSDGSSVASFRSRSPGRPAPFPVGFGRATSPVRGSLAGKLPPGEASPRAAGTQSPASHSRTTSLAFSSSTSPLVSTEKGAGQGQGQGQGQSRVYHHHPRSPSVPAVTSLTLPDPHRPSSPSYVANTIASASASPVQSASPALSNSGVASAAGSRPTSLSIDGAVVGQAHAATLNASLLGLTEEAGQTATATTTATGAGTGPGPSSSAAWSPQFATVPASFNLPSPELGSPVDSAGETAPEQEDLAAVNARPRAAAAQPRPRVVSGPAPPTTRAAAAAGDEASHAPAHHRLSFFSYADLLNESQTETLAFDDVIHKASETASAAVSPVVAFDGPASPVSPASAYGADGGGFGPGRPAVGKDAGKDAGDRQQAQTSAGAVLASELKGLGVTNG